MWNNWGEKSSGFVVQHHGKNKTQIKIQEIQPEGIKAETYLFFILNVYFAKVLFITGTHYTCILKINK